MCSYIAGFCRNNDSKASGMQYSNTKPPQETTCFCSLNDILSEAFLFLAYLYSFHQCQRILDKILESAGTAFFLVKCIMSLSILNASFLLRFTGCDSLHDNNRPQEHICI